MVFISYFFYGFFKWEYMALLLLVTCLSYFGGRLIWLADAKEERVLRNIDRSDVVEFSAMDRALEKLVFGRKAMATIIFTLLISCPLIVYKYFDFLSVSYAGSAKYFGADVDPFLLNVLLPMGISFFTIQGIGYVLDIYARRFAPERSFLDFTLFLSFFPQLVAGPIERATNIMPQLKLAERFEFARVQRGLQLILLGLFTKLVVADTTADFVSPVFDQPELYSGKDLLVTLLYFNWNLYADFMSYSIIAIGTARIFGVNLMENFSEPYFGGTVPEFWRRWHISLSSWVRDYLFTPLVTKSRNWGEYSFFFATFVTFIVIGVWHGAGWKFFLLGLTHATLVYSSFRTLRLRDKFWKKYKLLPAIKIVRIFTTFVILALSFVFFRAQNVQDAFMILGKIFTWASVENLKQAKSLDLNDNGAYVFVLLIIYDLIRRSGKNANHLPAFVKWIWYVFASGIVLYLLVQSLGIDKPFIYYQF